MGRTWQWLAAAVLVGLAVVHLAAQEPAATPAATPVPLPLVEIEEPAATPTPAGPPEGWFAFEPMVDEFVPTVIDRSSLVEAPTGLHGFVCAEGDRFVFEDGTPARFFGVEIDAFPKGQIEYTVKRLRKLGVNAVRLRGLSFLNQPKAASISDLDGDGIDRLDYAMAQLGEQGIYVILDVDDPAVLRYGPADKIPGLSGGGLAPLAQFFDPQAARLKWQRLRDVFMRRNPYTGKNYTEDPTLALVEIVHEDSLFWQSFASLTPPLRGELEQAFTDWLRKKYKDPKGLLKAWSYVGQSPLVKNEGIEKNQRVMLLPMSASGGESLAESPAKRRRTQDQLRFLLELETAYWSASREVLRQAGVRVPIAATNAGGPGPARRIHLYGQAQMDYVDRHGFWDLPQAAADSATLVAPRLFHDLPMVRETSATSRAALDASTGNLVLTRSWENVLGKPVTVSAWNTCLPNEHSLEGPGLMAAYGSLQGWDALIEYGYLSPRWYRRLSGSPVDLLSNAAQLLQFPAAATLWHRQDVKEARLVGETLYGFDDLFELAGDERPLPPEAALIGKVGYRFTPSGRAGVTEDVMRHWDAKALTARSMTGELIWNAGEGVVTIDTPRSQAAIGFLSTTQQRLSNVMVTTPTPFAAVWVTAAEREKPIVDATRLFITAVGSMKNTGMEYEQTAQMAPGRDAPLWHLKDDGNSPILIQAVQGEVRVLTHEAARLKAWALDLNGRRRAPIEVFVEGYFVRVPLSPSYRTVYYELAVE
jgi:hypothetical protein